MAAAVLAGCASNDPPGVAGACPEEPVSGMRDLHGLAVHPEDPAVLYAATHEGLLRAHQDANWVRVGATRDDLMGFTVHPADGETLWVSGHPGPRQNMGVRVSRDGGCTWTSLLREPVDFHAMTVSPADPDRLWGFYGGTLQRSTDGGQTWDAIAQPPGIISMAADPEDPDILHAATVEGLQRSGDGGRTWQTAREGLFAAVAVDPSDRDVLYLGGEGTVERSADGGTTWAPLASIEAGGVFGHIAVSPHDSDVLYVGSYQAGISKTTDGGASWSVVRAPSR